MKHCLKLYSGHLQGMKLYRGQLLAMLNTGSSAQKKTRARDKKLLELPVHAAKAPITRMSQPGWSLVSRAQRVDGREETAAVYVFGVGETRPLPCKQQVPWRTVKQQVQRQTKARSIRRPQPCTGRLQFQLLPEINRQTQRSIKWTNLKSNRVGSRCNDQPQRLTIDHLK